LIVVMETGCFLCSKNWMFKYHADELKVLTCLVQDIQCSAACEHGDETSGVTTGADVAGHSGCTVL
jgi:hypothetical protein